MQFCTSLIALTLIAAAQVGPTLPELVKLEQQSKPRSHSKLTLPPRHSIGPTIPGLEHGAIPQGLAFWKNKNWFLVSLYFEKTGKGNATPSVVVAIDAATKKMVRCLTLVEAGGRGHSGHVGGLAVSDKYLWVGSKYLYRAALADIEAAPAFGHLRLSEPFEAECEASYVAYADRRVWVGEFVSVKDGYPGKPSHHLKDRKGIDKYAWVAGYDLDAEENLARSAGRPSPPAVILSVRQNVQGLAFLGDQIVLSTSHGRTNDSTLAAYANPLISDPNKPHRTLKVGSDTFKIWFLDGENDVWKIDNYPPMSEGITAIDKRLAVLCESGARKYKTSKSDPLDSIIYVTPPAKK